MTPEQLWDATEDIRKLNGAWPDGLDFDGIQWFDTTGSMGWMIPDAAAEAWAAMTMLRWLRDSGDSGRVELARCGPRGNEYFVKTGSFYGNKLDDTEAIIAAVEAVKGDDVSDTDNGGCEFCKAHPCECPHQDDPAEPTTRTVECEQCGKPCESMYSHDFCKECWP